MRDDVLPKSWCATTLGEVISQFVGGGTPPKNDPHNFSGNIPFMTVKDMNVRRPKDTIDHITQKALDGSSAKLVPADTLVIATRMGLGKIVRPTIDVAINQDLKAIFLSNHLEKSFIENWFIYKAPYLETEGTGTTVKGLRLEFLRDLSFPLAPLNEQTRIVDKIEQLFSNLDEGEALLKQVQKQLATYRQSVLKAAVTGELTKEWREANKHRLESGDALLKRILKARRDNWNGRGKYKEPEVPDISNLPKLPDGWIWAAPEQLIDGSIANALCIGPFGSNLKVEDYTDSGVPLIFVRNIRARDFDGLNPQYVSQQKAKELSSHLVKGGDLLITKMGAPPGDVCLYPEGRRDAIITADCIRFCPNGNLLEKKYLELALQSQVAQSQIQGITKGVAQQKVTLGNFKRIALPLPSLDEQSEITNICDDIFSQIDALESWCASELTRSVTLRQSVLKDAFSGKLVPQDPNDDPASELLKRIQAERAKTAKTTKQKSSATQRPRGRRKIKESV